MEQYNKRYSTGVVFDIAVSAICVILSLAIIYFLSMTAYYRYQNSKLDIEINKLDSEIHQQQELNNAKR